ncbi:GAF domain-containing protein [Pseudonocardia acidicola]|uniref:GAF domain-containing protein n=1 Tax=Pseudonocardia acidicola TaxID=2724939 RepID=A0ABX1SL69_9PSEU|nr:GAF domain-containing protein [Pseudonocardia acidicola]NMI02325.1 GAF domain-containing protein [Pseudonocardia acidicola]
MAQDTLGVAFEVARIAASRGSVAQRAQALLEPLHRLVPFEGHWLALLDPDVQTFAPLAIAGHDERSRRRLEKPEIVAEVELLGVDRRRPAICVRDFPVPPQEVVTWADYMWPAGYRESLGVGLYTPDDRFLGILGLHTDTPAHPTDAARDLIGLLAPTIAAALDPTRTPAAAARAVRGAHGGGVLTRAGAVLPLTGLPGHPLLGPGAALLAVAARQVADGTQYAAFLCPDPSADARNGSGLRRVTVLGCAEEPPQFLCAALVVSEAGPRRGLTDIELEVLGMLLAEWPDARVAAALGASRYQLADHIDRAAARLGTADRGVAMVRAFNQGLYIPPGLYISPGLRARA